MQTATKSGLQKSNFEANVDGKQVSLFTLTNRNGVEVAVTNFGAKIASILVPDRDGKWTDVVLGKNNIADYMNEQEPYFGAICGRTANRIANGRFLLDGVKYELAINNGPNSLHGGIKGFNSVVWDAEQIDEKTLELRYLSPDGEEGFPGNLQVTLTYRLTDNDEVIIDYLAITDKTTILNLTNHSYFNLSGEGDANIGDHLLQINADTYLPTNDVAIPLGRPEEVVETPFDFRFLQPIGTRINAEHTQLIYGNGYDHNFILNKTMENELTFAAKAISPKTGIVMETYTTEPGVQLYTGNFLDGSFTGKNGNSYPKRSAFCLETQHFPDSIHRPEYPSVILEPDQIFQSQTVYRFWADK